jgi:Fuc2NAc and GlcNAc transferase
MTTLRLWWLAPCVAIGSALLTGALRQYALARNVVDVPGHRSAHTVPTPRGGGFAIVVSFLAAVAVLAWQGVVPQGPATALLGAGMCVAAIGFADDHMGVPAHWRLLVHFAASAWALFWIGGLGPVDALGSRLDLGWAGHVAAAIGLVWLLNLYNFMDGIDGIAATEAVTAGLSAALVYGVGAPADESWLLPFLLAMAALGFLAWNWPPAAIFMGDAGSGFLGHTVGVLAIISAWQQPELLWCWMILLSVFVVDATWTLVRRALRHEKLAEPHASHGYQHAARRTRAHWPITLSVAAINLFWLLPLALLVRISVLSGLSGLAMAYLPLLGLAVLCGAGLPVPPSGGHRPLTSKSAT